MELMPGQLVISTQGRDRGIPFVVLQIEETTQGTYVYLVDGKVRKVHQPKRKNIKHLKITELKNEELDAKLRAGLGITNSEIRKSIDVLLDFCQIELKNP